MNGISKLRLPKTPTALSKKKKLPQTSCLGHHPCSSILNCMLPILCYNSTEGFLFLYQPGSVLNFCLFRLSNTLSELWVSNSHTSWH